VLRSVDATLTPKAVLADSARKTGATILWGGLVGEVRVLDKELEVGVLAFPLDARGEPLVDGTFRGRFVVRYGYDAKTVRYVPGALLTVYGRVLGIRETPVGAGRLWVPIIEPLQTHPWGEPREDARNSLGWWPSIHFGIGVMGGF
jgi:starvation-inducible outer membrane lipoprotein